MSREPREAMVERLARMLDAGVLVLDGPSAGAVPDAERVRRRVAEREFEDDGWHVVTVPIPPAGWLAVAARRRVPLARAAAQAAVPLLAATERLAELAREQERAVRAALLDELLELAPGDETRGLAARAASFGVTFPARVVVSDDAALRPPGDHAPRTVRRTGRRGAGRERRPIRRRRRRPAVLSRRACSRSSAGVASYEAFDLPALLLCEVDPELVRPRVDALLDPLPERRLLDGAASSTSRATWTSTRPRPRCTSIRTRCATGSGESRRCSAGRSRRRRRSRSSRSRCRHEPLDVRSRDAAHDERERAGGDEEIPIACEASHVALEGGTRFLGTPWLDA